MKAAVTAVGALLLLDGLIVAAVSNLNLGVLLSLALGAAVLAYGIFFRRVNGAHGPLKWLRNLCFFGLGCVLALSVFLAVYGSMDSGTEDVDAVIVLGAAVHGDVPSKTLARRLDRAVKFHAENPEALIAVSGGRGAQEDISEAEAMRVYLIRKGVPEDKIIMEDRSVNTRENFRFSKEIIDERLGEGCRTAYITNDFHIYRAGLTAENEGLGRPAHYHAYTEWYTLPQNYLRECLAVVKTWIFG